MGTIVLKILFLIIKLNEFSSEKHNSDPDVDFIVDDDVLEQSFLDAGNNTFAKQVRFVDNKNSKGWFGSKVDKVNFHGHKEVHYGFKVKDQPNNNGGWRIPERPGSGPKIPEPDVPSTHGNGIYCSSGNKCQLFVHCSKYPVIFFKNSNKFCNTIGEGFDRGLCCPTIHPMGDTESIGKHFVPYPRNIIRIPRIGPESIFTAAKKGLEFKKVYVSIESNIIERGLIVSKGTPAYGHFLFFKTTPAYLGDSVNTFMAIKATIYIQDSFYLTPLEAGIGTQVYNFYDTNLGHICPVKVKCDQSGKYRTLDGTCNNPFKPSLGISGGPLMRLLPPAYNDGVWGPRTTRRDGAPLPSPRRISTALNPDMNNPDFRYSHLLMQFGQFVDHDLSHVPIFRLNDFTGIDCCKTLDGNPDFLHPACFPILSQEPAFQKQGGCMNFIRSMISMRMDCSFGHADQLNQVTDWLDGSQIYGSTLEQSNELREFSGGRLRITRDASGKRSLLPLDLMEESDCDSGGNRNLHCFSAGDKRVNEQIGLTSMHTIWLREHNRIAYKLNKYNPGLDDETLFHEARRIVVAEYEHIIYNEYLPILLGMKYMEVFGILPLSEGFNNYDPSIDPTVSNAFTTAAYRLHTLVNGIYKLANPGGSTIGRLALHSSFNNPHLLREPGAVDAITKGFLTQPIQMFDPYITTELRDKLFQNGEGFGLDLAAINIQRGRDHGLPSYNDYRDLCRLGKARTFADLGPIIPSHKIQHLETIYEDVDAIDLWIGGIHEQPVEGALLGPTFLCIVGDQFARSKKSDRYFYDIGDQPHSFTSSQLQAVRQTSMARIICDNTEIFEIQPLAFHLPNNDFNPVLPCDSPSIPRLDFGFWN